MFQVSQFLSILNVRVDEIAVLLPDAPGFATELVRDRLVYQVYDVLFAPQPFAGQFKDITQGAQDGVLHIEKAPDRDYGWHRVSTGVDRQCFVVYTNSDWIFDEIASLKAISIGAIRGGGEQIQGPQRVDGRPCQPGPIAQGGQDRPAQSREGRLEPDRRLSGQPHHQPLPNAVTGAS
ncbi:hypothetical protein [Dinoroseobacter sp. S124A]|uniref:hypothetical protein n=1 Tax=Dinoroseobacter sp. S124A TaxID=3415128 RepID=UPI003C7BA8D4